MPLVARRIVEEEEDLFFDEGEYLKTTTGEEEEKASTTVVIAAGGKGEGVSASRAIVIAATDGIVDVMGLGMVVNMLC
jgi:hypothetical protein